MKIAITAGDPNGIGYEVILKALEDPKILELFTPVIYGSARAAQHYRRMMDLPNVQLNQINDADQAKEGFASIITVTEDSQPEPGVSTPQAGKDAFAALEAAVADAEKYTSRIIVEHLVEDLCEINCSVLGNCDDYRMSVLEEPIKSGEILSYEDKYMGGTKTERGMQASKKRIPADLPADMTERIKFLAGETFRVLSCHGVSRVDFIVDRKDNSVYVNEINTIPGSLSFYLWEATGLAFDALMDELVRLAFKRKEEQSRKTVSYSANIFAMGGGVKGAKGAKGVK